MKSADTETGTLERAEIVERGDGPKINGTRITVYTIVEYLLGAWSKQRIADLLQLTEEQVQAAIDYIDANKLEVLRTYVKILERIQRGNPPEIQAKLDAGRGRARALMERIREAKARGASDADTHAMIEEYRKMAARRNGDDRDHGGQ